MNTLQTTNGPLRFSILAIALVTPAFAQSSTRIASPSKRMTVIDFDRMPAGRTSTPAISAAGIPSNARLRRVRLPAVGTGTGVYNTNTSFGKGLARVNGFARVIGNGGRALFQNFKAQFELGGPSTEFGIRIGDFDGRVLIDFFEGTNKTNTLVLRFDGSSRVQFGRYTPTAGALGFDRFDVRTLSSADNFVITELAIQNGGFPFPLARPVGSVNEPLSTVDFDNFPVGSTPNRQQINASGSNGGASLRRVILTPTGGNGIYNTDTNRGRALAVVNQNGSPTRTVIANDGRVTFQDFAARLDFATPSRVLGLGIGDVANTVLLDFYEGSTKTTTLTLNVSGSSPKFIEYVPSFGGDGFTRVDIRKNSGNNDFVITEILTPVLFDRIGTGCAGSSDPVSLSAATAPVIGTNFVTHLAGAPISGFSPSAVLIGSRRLSRPLDLAGLGAPGCSLLIDSAATLLNTKNPTTGQTTFALPVPNVRSLIGARLFEQGVDFDANGNALGLTTSNALGFTIR